MNGSANANPKAVNMTSNETPKVPASVWVAKAPNTPPSIGPVHEKEAKIQVNAMKSTDTKPLVRSLF